MASAPSYNGRIDFEGAGQVGDYSLFQECDNAVAGGCEPAIKGLFTNTAGSVSDVYFSAANLEALQQGIRYLVYVKSGQRHVIGRQSDTELSIVMRSIYLQYGRNSPIDILGQVRALNRMVLDDVVPRILMELNQYETYRADITQLPQPMERSQNMSAKGTKFLNIREF